MMMQIVRCESAVAQGLRSDTFQATKKAASASKRLPIPSLPFGLLVADLPTHNQPRTQMPPNLRHNWLFKSKSFFFFLTNSSTNSCLLAAYYQTPHVPR